jgi:hypothetical protein
VFEEAGWLGRDAVLMTGINAIIYVLSTLPPYVLDRLHTLDAYTKLCLSPVGTLLTDGDVGPFFLQAQSSYVVSLQLYSNNSSFLQMGIALAATGWWMYIDVPQTPKAVVGCVIVFNAAFGYSWGPIPWLYPPEVGWI